MKEFCFVIQPFDQGKFDKRYTDVIQPVVERVGLECYRVDEDPTVLVPITQIEKMIKESYLCIADITENNPNVWFEVGYAMACGKPLILTCSDERKSYPFDIQHRRILNYQTESLTDYKKYEQKLEEMIRGQMKNNLGTAAVAGKDVCYLEKDSEGYYQAKIVQNRGALVKSGKEYRCYQINGLVDTGEKPVENERHWIFYEAGRFQDLEVGDFVRFKMEKPTEVRSYKGAPNARNIYLEELEKV